VADLYIIIVSMSLAECNFPLSFSACGGKRRVPTKA